MARISQPSAASVAWGVFQQKYPGRGVVGTRSGRQLVNSIVKQIQLAPVINPQKRIVELGCGNTNLADAVAVRLPDYRVFSLEANENRPVGCGVFVAHSRAMIEAMPFADESFDFAFSSFAWCYTNLEQSGPELNRIIKLGGRVLLDMIHPESSWFGKIDHYRWLRQMLLILKEPDYKTSAGEARLKEFLTQYGARLNSYHRNADDSFFDRCFILRIAPDPIRIDRAIEELEGRINLDYDRNKLFKTKEAIADYAWGQGFKVISVALLGRGFISRLPIFRLMPDYDQLISWRVILEKNLKLPVVDA